MFIAKVTQTRGGVRSHALKASIIGAAIASIMPAAAALAEQPAESTAPAAASAPQASADGIEPTTTTARRVEEDLQKVPEAVTVLSGQALGEQSVTRLEDLSQTVAGFTAQPSYYASVPLYSIRGQHGATDPTLFYDPAVTVYFAEMNQEHSQGTNGEFFDLDSVQVLKGPQGTLFGRNTTGGAILIAPKAPDETFGGYARGSVGNFSYHDAEGALNLPLSDRVDLRVSGKFTRRDGYIENLTDGVNGNGLDSDAGRISLLLRPTDSVRSTLIGTYFESKDDGNLEKLSAVAPQSFQAFFVPNVVIAAFQQDAAAQAALGPYKLMSSTDLISHDRVVSLQDNTEIDLGDNLRIKNIVGYRRTSLNSDSDFTAASFPYFEIGNVNRSSLTTEELQLQGKMRNLEYVVGGYFLRETGNQGGGSVLAPVESVEVLSDLMSTTSYAAFAHGTYDLSGVVDGLSISAGARLTYDRKRVDYRILSTSGFVPGVYQCFLTGALVASADDFGSCSFPGSVNSTEPTYDVSLNYQVTPDLLAYVAHRRGYRAGGFNITPATANAPAYKPEHVDDFELGEKSDFHLGAMPGRLNTAVYYQDYRDIQRNVAFANGYANVAKAKIYGGELELRVKPTRALELAASYSYVKAEYSKWIDPYTSPFAAPGTPAVNLDISDSLFSFVPTHQWSASARYALPIPAQIGDELSLSAIWYGQSAMATNDNSTSNCGPDGFYTACYGRQFQVPAYNLLNVRLEWKNIVGAGIDLALFANNVTNRVYTNDAFGFGGVLGTNAIGYGPPRMYGLTLTVPFGSDAH